MNERTLVNNFTCFDEKQLMYFITNTAEWWNVASMVWAWRDQNVNDSLDVRKWALHKSIEDNHLRNCKWIRVRLEVIDNFNTYMWRNWMQILKVTAILGRFVGISTHLLVLQHPARGHNTEFPATQSWGRYKLAQRPSAKPPRPQIQGRDQSLRSGRCETSDATHISKRRLC